MATGSTPDGYRKVLQFRDAHPVSGRTNVWRIPPSNPFTDAFYVKRTDDTVVVVNAPTVSDLNDIWNGVDGT